MKEENKILTQWLFPTLILIVVIISMIINFNVRSNAMAVTTVSRDLAIVSERYAAELERDLVVMSSLTRAAAEAISNVEQLEINTEKTVISILDGVRAYSFAYKVLHVDESGFATLNDGSRMNLATASYYNDIIEKGSNNYLFVMDDEIKDSNMKAIIYTSRVPGNGNSMVISYYPIENMSKSVKRTDFDGDILYMLLNNTGTDFEVLAYNKNFKSNFITYDFTAKLRGKHGAELRRMDIRLKNGYSDTMKVEVEGEARTLVYTPLSMNNWFVIVGVNEGFVEVLERRVWEYTRRTLLHLALVIGGFAVCMVIINMVAKIRSTSKTKELMVKADTDLLTGLLNKVATERRVMEYMENYPNEQALMFVLDIDNFKKINDTMGHAFGDEVLRSLGQQITPIFRATDIIGRIGGDELIILLKNIYNDENLLREAEKVARFFHEFKAGEYVKYSATASIGAAIFPRDGKDFESMYKAADQALYMAKKRGKNQLAFYHDTFDAVVIKS